MKTKVLLFSFVIRFCILCDSTGISTAGGGSAMRLVIRLISRRIKLATIGLFQLRVEPAYC